MCQKFIKIGSVLKSFWRLFCFFFCGKGKYDNVVPRLWHKRQRSYHSILFYFQSENELMLPEDFAVKDISAFKAIPFVYAVISLVCLTPSVFGYFMKNICWFDLHKFLGDLKRDPKSEKRWAKRSNSVYRDMRYIKFEKKNEKKDVGPKKNIG